MTTTLPVVTLAEVRRRALAAQRFAQRGPGSDVDEVEAAIRRLPCVQLDTISTVARSHRIVLGSRIGPYVEEAISRLLASGRVFEYWAHEACLLPAEAYPLVRHRMGGDGRWETHRRVLGEHPDVVDAVLARLREEGPLPSRAFESGRDAYGQKAARTALAALWDRGVVAVAGRPGGQRLYDVAERVIPREQLDAREPSEPELLRALVETAVRARGVLTESAVVEHWRLRGGVARIRSHADELVREGVLRRLAVDDGGAPVLVPAGAEPDRAPLPASVLLSPFDNLLWDRAFTRRLFSFEHVIEIYKPTPRRVYGYYVLPLLAGDRLVGRADLKTDRRDGVLRVLAFHREPGVRPSRRLDEAFDAALARLARIAGIERVER